MAKRTGVILATMLLVVGSAQGADELTVDPARFDANVGPCEDFYRHVNGAWLDATEIPADQPTWGARYQVILKNREIQRTLAERAANAVREGRASGVEKLVGAFYASGMDEAAIEKAGLDPLRSELQQIEQLRGSRDVVRFIGAHAGYDLTFAYYIYPDADDSATNIAYVEQGGLGLGNRSLYLDTDAATSAKRDAYLAYLTRLLALSGTPGERAARDAAAVLVLETALAQASLPLAELRLTQNNYHRLSLAEAARITPHLDWREFFDRHHAPVQALSLAQPEFFAEFDRRLASAPMDTWRAYLRTHMLDLAAPALSSPFASAHFEFHDKALRGLSAPPPRWRRVLESLNDRLGMAMAQLYVREYFPASAKQAALELVEDVRVAFRARLGRADWLSTQTRHHALDKLAAMEARIGYPDRWRDYQDLTLNPDSYADNIRRTLEFDTAYAVVKLGRPVERDEWGMLPQAVNATYDPARNVITFPAAILQAPAFDAAADPALNYGAIGVIIAHEITHGFDDTGRGYDAQGNHRDWWTADDATAFEARAQRVVEQFDAYEELPGAHVNGRQTVGENIADLGGLEIAFDALQRALARRATEVIDGPRRADTTSVDAISDGLTPAQRFFVRYASIWRSKAREPFAAMLLMGDTHAPDRWRALGPLSNSKAFADAFACQPGKGFVRGEAQRIGLW